MPRVSPPVSASRNAPGVGSRRRILRVAFQPFGGANWLGGIHYLTTLLSALHEHAAGEVEPILFAPSNVESEVIAHLRPYLASTPVMLPSANSRRKRALRTLNYGVQRCNRGLDLAFRRENIDLAFQHSNWLGSRLSIPTLAWLGDFQHRVMPEMFRWHQWWRRELRFRTVLCSANLLYVLSEADRVLGEGYYPHLSAKLRALPFAVTAPPVAHQLDPISTVHHYGLPSKFVLFPGQFWKHKNHLTVVEAVWRLKQQGLRATIVSCGRPVDHRDRSHAPRVMGKIAELGLVDEFRVLGVVPRDDLWALMRASAAVLNPSLYEGWSTPVEEAKSLGVPLLLSDLPVHREQKPTQARFFDPRQPTSLADTLAQAWPRLHPGPRLDAELKAAQDSGVRRAAFARSFVALAAEAIDAAAHR